jgi:hypothetical protein
MEQKFHDRKLAAPRIAVEKKWKFRAGFRKAGKWLAGIV